MLDQLEGNFFSWNLVDFQWFSLIFTISVPLERLFDRFSPCFICFGGSSLKPPNRGLNATVSARVPVGPLPNLGFFRLALVDVVKLARIPIYLKIVQLLHMRIIRIYVRAFLHIDPEAPSIKWVFCQCHQAHRKIFKDIFSAKSPGPLDYESWSPSRRFLTNCDLGWVEPQKPGISCAHSVLKCIRMNMCTCRLHIVI